MAENIDQALSDNSEDRLTGMDLLADEIGIPVFFEVALVRAYEKLAGIEFAKEGDPSQEELTAFRTYLIANYKKMREEMGYIILMLEENGVQFSWSEGETKDHLIQSYNRIEQWALANGGTKKGGCYIATAVYGSYDCPQVWTLRRFRDYALSNSMIGRAFIKVYYAVSPSLVKHFSHHKWFVAIVTPLLDCMVKRLNSKGTDDTPYYD